MKRRCASATHRPPVVPAGPPSGATLLAALGLAKIQTSDVAAWEAIIRQLEAEIVLSDVA